MATATDFPSNHRSPTDSGFSGEKLNSPEFQRSNLRQPWSQIVRGEPESISPVDHSPLSSSSSSSLSSLAASVPENSFSVAPSSPPPDNLASSSSYEANDGNATAPPRKPAWNKPSNGVVEAGPVMGAAAWPALSKSPRASPKLPVDSPIKPTTEGSVPTPQVPVIDVPPQKQSSNNVKSNSTPKQPMAARQRPTRRSGGSSVGGPARGGFVRPSLTPTPPPFPAFHIPPNSYCNMVPAIPDPSPGEPLYRNNNRDPRPVAGFAPQTNAATDRRNFFPRGNFGFHPRSDGHYQNNRGGKRDQDRGMYPNARDVQLQHPRPPTRGFLRPSPSYPAQFPQPVRPHGNPMAPPTEFLYFSALPPEPFSGVPFMPPPAMYIPVVDPYLSALLVKQIDYYFSDANLVKDGYLKSKMDDQGWVPISEIANFYRVQNLTTNIQLIVEALRTSTIVEVQGYRVRRRNEWKKWITTPNWLGTDLATLSPSKSGTDKLVTSFERVSVDEGKNRSLIASDTDPHNETATEILSSESAGNSQLINGEVNQDVQSDF